MEDDYRNYGYGFRAYGKDGPLARPYPLEEGKVYMVFDGRLYSCSLNPGSLNWQEEPCLTECTTFKKCQASS